MKILHVCKFSAAGASRVVMQMAWDGGAAMDRGGAAGEASLGLSFGNLYRQIAGGHWDRYVFHMQSALPYFLFARLVMLFVGGRAGLVYDIHDLHEWPSRQPVYAKFRWLVLGLFECLAFRVADSVMTVSKGLAGVYYRRFGRRPRVIYNIPQSALQVGSAARAGLLYFGLIDKIRLPETALAAIAQHGVTLDIYGIVREQDADYLELLRRMEAAGAIRMMGRYYPDDLAFVGRYVAALLTFDCTELNIRYCLPNKLFQALSQGTPCLVSDGLFEVRNLFRRHAGFIRPLSEFPGNCGVDFSTGPGEAERLFASLLALQDGSRSTYLRELEYLTVA